MAESITNELMYEVLKQLQKDMSSVRATLADHSCQLIWVREDINSVRDDINGLRGDDLRRENLQTQMDIRLERIETRLNLSDA